MSYDPEQRFLQLVPGGNGIIYAIQADGALYWYRNLGWSTGSASWANGGNSRQIGTDWQVFRLVLASYDGQIFAILPNGDLLWYKYILTNGNTGAGYWHGASGNRIGSGWNFPRVFGGPDSVLYGEDGTGKIFWYRYLGGNGSAYWHGASGSQIGSGFNEYLFLTADLKGVIYGARQGGALKWWRHLTYDGRAVWANGGAAVDLGIGWAPYAQKTIFANGSGTLYAVQLSTSVVPGPDGDLAWYRLYNSETIDSSGVRWYNNGFAKRIGSGFTMESSAALQGYPSVLSTPQGGSVDIQVSSTFPSYASTTLRLAPAAGNPIPMSAPVTRQGQFQQVQSGYRSAGCGWAASFQVSVPSDWPSGIYSSLLESPVGNQHHVMFAVRPAAPQQQIAVLVPTNTYNAYNIWGGHNQYSVGQEGVQRTVTLARPNAMTFVSASGIIDHLLYSDLLLLRWLTSQNINYDVYTDQDLHTTGATWLPNYRALVLTSHPEYFSETARQNVVNYQNAGGRLIYTGGNGIYERMSYTPDGHANIFRRADGERDLFEESGQSETQILGVAIDPASYMNFAPYIVRNNHPFLNGTGLSVGSTFGNSSYNGKASGWEVDSRIGSVPGAVLIAEGLNTEGGAEMLYVPKPNNGWVFAASSLAFNGAVPVDSAIQQILRNVFAAAVT